MKQDRRQEESKDAGGSDFGVRVYEAERPEVFINACSFGWIRMAMSGSASDLHLGCAGPEPTLVVNRRKTVGYTIGNDGEQPQ